jgi:hypothetical protein
VHLFTMALSSPRMDYSEPREVIVSADLGVWAETQLSEQIVPKI